MSKQSPRQLGSCGTSSIPVGAGWLSIEGCLVCWLRRGLSGGDGGLLLPCRPSLPLSVAAVDLYLALRFGPCGCCFLSAGVHAGDRVKGRADWNNCGAVCTLFLVVLTLSVGFSCDVFHFRTRFLAPPPVCDRQRDHRPYHCGDIIRCWRAEQQALRVENADGRPPFLRSWLWASFSRVSWTDSSWSF